MKLKRKKLMSGQTLIEAIVATAVVVLLVTGLIAGTTSAIKVSQSARRRSLGTKLTQEGLEVVRNLRDNGWNNFFNLNPAGTRTYCVNLSGTLLLSPPAVCTGNITITEGSLSLVFTRSVRFTWNPVDSSMNVYVEVTWSEGTSTRTSNAQTRLTNWR